MDILSLRNVSDLSGTERTQEVVVNRVAPAWARDADGKPVPTRYELRGSDLVQVVEHTTGNFRYPVTADPWWSTAWKVVKCATAVAFVALTPVFVVGKALKVVKAAKAARRWVTSMGGANNAARLIVGGLNPGRAGEVGGVDKERRRCLAIGFFRDHPN